MGVCIEPAEVSIITEYIANGDLQTLLDNKSIELSMCKRMQMARDVAHGMNWLHLQKPAIVHQDLKTSNLLVNEYYCVKICDFGLSRTMLEMSAIEGRCEVGNDISLSNWCKQFLCIGHALLDGSRGIIETSQ